MREAMHASLWLRVPDAMQSISAITQAYDLLREVREKHPRNACRAQEAAVALRDVIVLRVCCAFAFVDSAITEILGGAVCGSSPQSMVELRSQFILGRPAICRLSQCRAAFDRAVPQIFRAPSSAQGLADIFVAYSDCAQSIDSVSSSPTPYSKMRIRKSKQSRDVASVGSAAEGAPHAQNCGSTLADAAARRQHPMEPWRLSPT